MKGRKKKRNKEVECQITPGEIETEGRHIITFDKDEERNGFERVELGPDQAKKKDFWVCLKKNILKPTILKSFLIQKREKEK